MSSSRKTEMSLEVDGMTSKCNHTANLSSIMLVYVWFWWFCSIDSLVFSSVFSSGSAWWTMSGRVSFSLNKLEGAPEKEKHPWYATISKTGVDEAPQIYKRRSGCSRQERDMLRNAIAFLRRNSFNNWALNLLYHFRQ